MTRERRAIIARAKKNERAAVRRARYYITWNRFRTGRDYPQAIRELLYAAEQRAFVEGLSRKDEVP